MTSKLCPDAKPHSVFSPTHAPLPLRPQVADELNRMEEAGVISKVTQLTPRWAGMVVISADP